MVSDANGNIFIADVDNHCIRKIEKYVNLGNGQVVSTFAGAMPTPGLPGYGTSGNVDGVSTAARFNKPTDIAIDKDGNFYVTDYDNMTIRKISSTGRVTTLAGQALTEGFSDGTTGTSARFGTPWGVSIYNDNSIVVSDPWNTNIRKINIYSGETSTLAGPTTMADPRQVDGTLTDARFKSPKGITVVDGIIYVADQNTIRAIDEKNNTVTTFAGDVNKFEIIDGSGKSAAFTELSGLTTDNQGNLYATENSLLVASHVIRKITINNLAPLANFKASKTNALVNETITFEDISSGQEPTSRNWSFKPTTFDITIGDINSEKMSVTFSEAGFYEVSLQIANDFGTNTKTTKDYIAVSTTGNVERYNYSNLISVYPNPAQNYVTVQIDPSIAQEKPLVKLFNSNGVLIQKVNDYQFIDVSNLSPGVYFLTVECNSIHTAKKISIGYK
jgi:PKD repeat protein